MKRSPVSILRKFPDLCCQNPHCRANFFSPQGLAFSHLIRHGSYRRSSDQALVPRFRCKLCRSTVSLASLEAAFGQKKRQLNETIRIRLATHGTLRGIARELKISRSTVSRKLRFLASQSRGNLKRFLSSRTGSQRILQAQMDEMVSYEHTKCKPLHLGLVVEEGSRLILGMSVASAPASGRLASLSLKKYGRRRDRRRAALLKLLRSLRWSLHPELKLTSDSHPFYPGIITKVLGKQVQHRQVLSRDAHVAGQGEMKKGGQDPIFSLNHTAAMIRAHVNRLIRRTWCSTKKPKALEDHLLIYADFHNQNILRKMA